MTGLALACNAPEDKISAMLLFKTTRSYLAGALRMRRFWEGKRALSGFPAMERPIRSMSTGSFAQTRPPRQSDVECCRRKYL